jgi:signal transduction histidine kinase
MAWSINPSRTLGSPRPLGHAVGKWFRAPRYRDCVLGVALTAFAGLEARVYDLPLASVVSVAICGLALTVRRTAPLVPVFAAAAAPLIDRALGGPWSAPSGTLAAAVLAAYSVARFAPMRPALAGGAVVLAGVWLRLVWIGAVDTISAVTLARITDPLTLVYFAVVVAVPWLAGRASRTQHHRAETLEVLATELERQRDAAGRLAVAEERTRLAQELRDAVAKAVTAMLADAATAQRTLASVPARSREALRAIRETGREAIGDLGEMLVVLRVKRPDVVPDAAAERLAATIADAQTPRRWSARADVLLGVAALTLTLVESRGNDLYWQPVPLLLLVPLCLSLTFRRRYPVGVLLTVAGAAAARHVLIGPAVAPPVGALLAMFVATYSVAVYTPPAVSLTAVSVTGVAVAILELWVADAVDSGTPHLTFLLTLLFSASVPFLSGLAVRAYRLQAERLQVLAGRLLRERDARARLAVVEERTRIARDLHDTVARGVSVIVLQAGAGEELLNAGRGDCRPVLRSILEVGRETLDELARLLAALDIDQQPVDRPTRATLAELDALVAQTQRAGLPVTLHIEGHRTEIPASIDASAFRIIQESLTNALKHAGPAPTAITVRYDRDGLDLEIVNARARAGDRRDLGGSGHGIEGMRERVALHHGSLDVGPRPDGGYRVHAHLLRTSGT